jgi:hypothetical protein
MRKAVRCFVIFCLAFTIQSGAFAQTAELYDAVKAASAPDLDRIDRHVGRLFTLSDKWQLKRQNAEAIESIRAIREEAVRAVRRQLRKQTDVKTQSPTAQVRPAPQLNTILAYALSALETIIVDERGGFNVTFAAIEAYAEISRNMSEHGRALEAGELSLHRRVSESFLMFAPRINPEYADFFIETLVRYGTLPEVQALRNAMLDLFERPLSQVITLRYDLPYTHLVEGSGQGIAFRGLSEAEITRILALMNKQIFLLQDELITLEHRKNNNKEGLNLANEIKRARALQKQLVYAMDNLLLTEGFRSLESPTQELFRFSAEIRRRQGKGPSTTYKTSYENHVARCIREYERTKLPELRSDRRERAKMAFRNRMRSIMR